MLADPCAATSFTDCILDPTERTFRASTAALHRDLLRLRRDGAAIAAGDIDGAVLSEHAFALAALPNRRAG